MHVKSKVKVTEVKVFIFSTPIYTPWNQGLHVWCTYRPSDAVRKNANLKVRSKVKALWVELDATGWGYSVINTASRSGTFVSKTGSH